MTELQLVPEPSAIRTARERVRELGLPEPPERDAALLVSELVTNAVEHADLDSDARITLRTELDGRVRVEVCNPGPGFPLRARDRALEDEGGWGLVLVERLAEKWGLLRERGHTCVWFEFPLEAAA